MDQQTKSTITQLLQSTWGFISAADFDDAQKNDISEKLDSILDVVNAKEALPTAVIESVDLGRKHKRVGKKPEKNEPKVLKAARQPRKRKVSDTIE